MTVLLRTSVPTWKNFLLPNNEKQDQIKMKRLGSPTFFGQKWYPMTLRPAAPYAVGMAIWYWAVTKIDQAANGSEHGALNLGVFCHDSWTHGFQVTKNEEAIEKTNLKYTRPCSLTPSQDFLYSIYTNTINLRVGRSGFYFHCAPRQ